jgi:hypothetical protein
MISANFLPNEPVPPVTSTVLPFQFLLDAFLGMWDERARGAPENSRSIDASDKERGV